MNNIQITTTFCDKNCKSFLYFATWILLYSSHMNTRKTRGIYVRTIFSPHHVLLCVVASAFTGDTYLHVGSCCSACVDSGQSVDSIILIMLFLKVLVNMFSSTSFLFYSSATYACVCQSIMKKSFPYVSNIYFCIVILAYVSLAFSPKSTSFTKIKPCYVCTCF